MSTSEVHVLIVNARKAGLRFTIDGDRVRVQGPRPSVEVLAGLQEHQPQVLELIRHEASHGGEPLDWQRSDLGGCPACHPATHIWYR
jgi:hypothetical protein